MHWLSQHNLYLHICTNSKMYGLRKNCGRMFSHIHANSHLHGLSQHYLYLHIRTNAKMHGLSQNHL